MDTPITLWRLPGGAPGGASDIDCVMEQRRAEQLRAERKGLIA